MEEYLQEYKKAQRTLVLINETSNAESGRSIDTYRRQAQLKGY